MFRMIINETTDCSVQKSCVVIVKYFDAVRNQITTKILDLIDICKEKEGEWQSSWKANKIYVPSTAK